MRRYGQQTFADRVRRFVASGSVPAHAPDLGECHVWTGAKVDGYGRVHVDGQVERAHRASYRAFVGPIPDGMHIDHLCRNRACIRPSHLEVVTQAENNRRAAPFAVKPRGEACRHGHPLVGDNVRPNGACRACWVDCNARYYQRRGKALRAGVR